MGYIWWPFLGYDSGESIVTICKFDELCDIWWEGLSKVLLVCIVCTVGGKPCMYMVQESMYIGATVHVLSYLEDKSRGYLHL